MKQFLSVEDVQDPNGLVEKAIELKKNPYAFQAIGKK